MRIPRYTIEIVVTDKHSTMTWNENQYRNRRDEAMKEAARWFGMDRVLSVRVVRTGSVTIATYEAFKPIAAEA